MRCTVAARMPHWIVPSGYYPQWVESWGGGRVGDFPFELTGVEPIYGISFPFFHQLALSNGGDALSCLPAPSPPSVPSHPLPSPPIPFHLPQPGGPVPAGPARAARQGGSGSGEPADGGAEGGIGSGATARNSRRAGGPRSALASWMDGTSMQIISYHVM